ncbi:MAG: conjugal transfer protein TraR [bacterium]
MAKTTKKPLKKTDAVTKKASPAKKSTAPINEEEGRIKPVKKAAGTKDKSGVTINIARTFTKPKPLVIPQPEEKKLRKFKPNKKTRYTKLELKHFRDIILAERKSIFESAKANMDALVDKDSGEYKGDNLTYSSHMAEQGTDEMEREKNYMFVQRDEKYLGYLQDALMRIDQGTYGICVDCRDEPKNLCRTCPLVVKERLELVPITQHCIECKNLRGSN